MNTFFRLCFRSDFVSEKSNFSDTKSDWTPDRTSIFTCELELKTGRAARGPGLEKWQYTTGQVGPGRARPKSKRAVNGSDRKQIQTGRAEKTIPFSKLQRNCFRVTPIALQVITSSSYGPREVIVQNFKTI